MLMIYQIGDAPLFFTLRSKAGDSVSIRNSREWKAPFVEFTGAPGNTFVGDAHQVLPESQKLDISGEFICDDGVSAEKMLRHLNSFGGVPQIPIIAFRYQECDHVDNLSCCQKCNSTLDWIVNYGIITKIEQDSNYNNTDELYASMFAPVSITMTLGTKWKHLNAYEWEYRSDRVLNPFVGLEAPNKYFIPITLNGLQHNNYFFRWNTVLSKYSPTFWGIKYGDEFGGLGSDFSDVLSTDVFSDPQIWSAPPTSAYAFTNINNVNSELAILVQRNIGLFDSNPRIETSTLDLDQLNTDMISAGYGGLYQSDVIFTGAVQPFPGFITRNGSRINVRPRWTYSGIHPGETGIGFNKVSFSCLGNSVKVAYVHDYGMY